MSSWPAAFVDPPQKLTNMEEDDEARKRRRLGEGDEGGGIYRSASINGMTRLN
jgi:hypothetical protein